MTAPKAHPAVVCPKHPGKPRRWKHPGVGRDISVCSGCSPRHGQAVCIRGHRDRVWYADGKMRCRACRKIHDTEALARNTRAPR